MSGYNFTDEVRFGLQAAREEAYRLRHDEVQPIHIVLGLLRRPGKTFGAALSRLGAAPDELSKIVSAAVPPPLSDAVGGPDFPYTSAAKRVLERSMEEARGLQHAYVGAEHLFLGVLSQHDEVAKLLTKAGVTSETFRGVLRDLGPSEPAGAARVGAIRYSLEGSPKAVKLVSFFFVTAGPAAWLALLLAVIALVLAIRAQP
jgi:ATP-dependent Clp protease ATP-binding subunit ClpC